MADKIARSRQYEYRATSNLVLMADRRGKIEAGAGEAESLAGRISHRFGDKAIVRSKEVEEKLKKYQKSVLEKKEDESSLLKMSKKESVMQTKIDDTLYQPRTRETRLVYEQLLGEIKLRVGDQPGATLRGFADEILAILKNDNLKEPDRKKLCSKVLNLKSEGEQEEVFNKLSALGRKITDYVDESAAANNEINEDEGIAIVFPDDADEDEENEQFEIRDEASDEEMEDEEAARTALRAKVEEEGERDENDKDFVDAREIGPYWLQKQMANFQSDALETQRLATEVLSILETAKDGHDCENQLVDLIGFDHFDLIRLLRNNQLKILYCTKLGQAQDGAEKEKLKAVMAHDPALSEILDEYEGKKVRAKSKGTRFEDAIRDEARRLHKELAGNEEEYHGADVLAARRMLDLDALSFAQGSHFMSNKKCKLPDGSKIMSKKGYDEIHIPAPKMPEFQPGEKLVSVKELPDWAQIAFPGVDSLNRIQSQVYPKAFKNDENLLICAPTGSGKTNCAMLTILHEIGKNLNEDGSVNVDAFKIIYVAPMKSLVQEMVGNFSKRLEPYGMQVRELSGDVNLTKAEIAETQVIVTTPEKWDIITRKSGERAFTELVRLVIIDEIHLLHDERGPVLEAIVARTLRQIETTQEMVRLVGLSATLPGYQDVATFLRVEPENIVAFESSYRPVPLEQQFIGITEKKAIKRFNLMNEICYEKVMDNAGKNQVLVFVHSRKETYKTARAIIDMAMQNNQLSEFLRDKTASREILLEVSEETAKNPHLKEILPFGFAIHHAGMLRTDRELVEALFAQGHVQVLVSTATLAWGVNLPAHTVIIKGTQVYNPEKGAWTELSGMDVMQMLGRAGRPQYDRKGEGVLITTRNELQYYLSLMNNQLPVESQFIKKLADNLNAEVVMGTVQSVSEAVSWLGYTYLYICMLRSPTLYGISFETYEKDKLLEQRRTDLIHTAATILDKSNLMKYDKKTGHFQVTNLGRVAAHYYISHQSISVYNEQLRPTMSDIDLFRLFSLSNEFKYMSTRQEEKLELEKLLERVPIPVKEGVDEPCAKVNVLLQAYISRLKLEGFALMADMVYVTQSAARIIRALFEIVLKRGWAQLADRCLNLSKMVAWKMWLSQSPLRQFSDIPEAIIKKIERKDFPFDRLYHLKSQQIGELIHFPSEGKKIFDRVHNVPRLELSAYVQPITRSILKVELTIVPDFNWDRNFLGTSQRFWILVEDVDGETILHYEYFILKEKYSKEDHLVSFTVPLYQPMPPQYYIRIVSDRWIGSETVLPVMFNRLLLPEPFQDCTKLLDMQPIPVSSLKDEHTPADLANKFKSVLQDIQVFNPIQTQVFAIAYKTDNNLLVGAPTGSGKTVIAELTIFRTIANNPKEFKCVYVAPYPALCNERYLDWLEKFSKLGYNVVELTGDSAKDRDLLAKGHIIVATPEHWDMISRLWDARDRNQNRVPTARAIEAVNLFIIDELHLVGAEPGPTIEVIVSRMRFIAQQRKQHNEEVKKSKEQAPLQRDLRMVGLCSSVANARDLAEWIGSNKVFNFHPNNRPVPLEIHLKGFEEPNFENRVLSMRRPTINAITERDPEKPCIVFVPSRKQLIGLARDVQIFCESSPNPSRFLGISQDDLQPYVENIENKFLLELLRYGIGILHENLSETERNVVERLFDAGAIQLIIATRGLCWGMKVSAHIVVIMGTQFYDGKEHRYTDYPIADMLQMMGRSSRPQYDKSGKCFILCHAPKRDFFKKFLFEPLPVESHLDRFLADHLNAEIVNGVISNAQEAIDYMTWTLYYRRLPQNPNYYNLHGTTNVHVSHFLSDLLDTTAKDLIASQCISVDESDKFTAENLGIIAARFYIKYTTVEIFSQSITAKTKLKGLIEIITNATEYDVLPIRHGEAKALQQISGHLPIKVEHEAFNDANAKAYVLLLCHFSRMSLPPDLVHDQRIVLQNILKLIEAAVFIMNSSNWLNPALACMELAQMTVQAIWTYESPLKQIPHFSEEVVKRCNGAGVEGVLDIMELEDDKRDKLLQFDVTQMQNAAIFCNRYPNIDVDFEVQDDDNIHAKGEVSITVQLDRDMDEEEVGDVIAPFYPGKKLEGWWILIGDKEKNHLLTMKKIPAKNKVSKVSLEFEAPETPGEYEYTLYIMCDSYIGCDQEYSVKINVKEAEAESDSSDSDAMEE